MSGDAQRPTADAAYAKRLEALENARWRRVLNVQAPYRWNIRRLQLGRTLDVGAGLGRNLMHLDGNGVAVDHNTESIAIARSRGLEAYTVEEFFASEAAVLESFDSMLMAHVLEHMDRKTDLEVARMYLPYLKPGGKVVFITPQEAGYKSDATHVQFVDFDASRAIARELGLTITSTFSFPLPRAAGKVFPYNEFVLLALKQ